MKRSSVLWAAMAVNFIAVAAASSRAAESPRDLARSKEWLRLLHYKKPGFASRLQSEVDAPGFFLSKTGKSDPESELLSDLDHFRRGEAQCAFPLRFQFLQTHALLEGVQQSSCPEYQDFLSRFRAASATLVFSSAYAGSPASMFGHTFLRINAVNDREHAPMDLLDMGIGYAAVVPEKENSFVYAWLGLTGGYPGKFSVEPYYFKVREYNHAESRDLWEYDLGLSSDETRRLISHVWEIEKNGGFYYYFLTRNCSYQLLALLEAVRSDWDLTDHFIHEVPAETVKKVLATSGAVRNIKIRPSLHKRVLLQYSALTLSERNQFRDLTDGKLVPEKTDDVKVLDTALEYWHLEKERGAGRLPAEEETLLKKTLTQRSQLPAEITSVPTSYDEMEMRRLPALQRSILNDTRPEAGHGPYRIGSASGIYSLSGRSSPFVDLNLKGAYHDLLNDDRGYSPYSEVNFPMLTLRYRPDDRRLSIEQLLLFSITALNPVTAIDKKISWHVQADYHAAKDFGCLDCHLFRAEGAIGETLPLFSDHSIASLMLYGYVEGGESLQAGFRGGPKLELSTIVNPLPAFKSRLAATAVGDVLQTERSREFTAVEWQNSYSLNPSWEVRSSFLRDVHLHSTPDYSEVQLTLHRYF